MLLAIDLLYGLVMITTLVLMIAGLSQSFFPGRRLSPRDERRALYIYVWISSLAVIAMGMTLLFPVSAGVSWVEWLIVAFFSALTAHRINRQLNQHVVPPG